MVDPSMLAPHPFYRERKVRAEGACGGSWDYQWCTEMVQPFASNGVTDMFWPPAPFNASAAAYWCNVEWGVAQRGDWARVNWGGRRLGGSASTCLVMSLAPNSNAPNSNARLLFSKALDPRPSYPNLRLSTLNSKISTAILPQPLTLNSMISTAVLPKPLTLNSKISTAVLPKP